ncbi:MAG TPA: hypothetical protein VMM13_14635 [Euzebya sp.]|nr:hypothetical protein [Euzebya sp.]
MTTRLLRRDTYTSTKALAIGGFAHPFNRTGPLGRDQTPRPSTTGTAVRMCDEILLDLVNMKR